MRKRIIEERRLGKVVVNREVFETADEAVTALFKVFLPCRCEYLFASNDLEYVGYSEQFDSLPLSCPIPRYDAIFSTMVVRTVQFQAFQKAEDIK